MATNNSSVVRTRRVLKELRQLHEDPPSNVCVIRPAPDAVGADARSDDDAASIFSVAAQIAAPAGTPWEGGVFDVEVTVPERYPFEPPNVVFGTPIYHPNIDSGGRICLSTLNMPPKGTWKPSSNIRTVLVSVLCLIGEPNGDDGLMQEITDEYVHRRDKFNETARLWTRRHAMGTASVSRAATEKRKAVADAETAQPETRAVAGGGEGAGEENKENDSGARKAVTPSPPAADAAQPRCLDAARDTGTDTRRRSRLQKRPRTGER